MLSYPSRPKTLGSFSTRRRFLVSLIVGGAAYFRSAGGYALPIDTFNIPSETRCKGERTCKRNLANEASLGGFLGLEVQNPAEGKGITLLEIKTGPTKGRVVWGAAGSPAGRLTLFWDGDPNPSQVSGAGLGCLNLLADGATAFILEDLAYSATCSKNSSAEKPELASDNSGALCPPLVIESKIYDALDPTGQRYSTSVIRRHHRMSGKDLRIPFSSFTQEGPNGGAHPTCVGAISVAIRADDLTKSVVTFGPMYTNGACQTGNCLLPPPFMPEGSGSGTPNVPTPTGSSVPSVERSTTTIAGATASTTPPVQADKTPTLSPSKAPSTPPTVTPTVKQSPTPKVTPTSTAIESTLKLEKSEGKSTKEASSTVTEMVPKEAPTMVPPPITEEFIFGEVVEHKAAEPSAPAPVASAVVAEPTLNNPEPTQAPLSTRRPAATIDPLDLIP